MAQSTAPFQLYQLASAHYVSQAVYVVARLGIADHLAGGARTAEELAQVTETHAPSLRRVLRLVAAYGVLSEDADGGFGLTPMGEALRSGPGSAAAAVQLFAGPSQWATWGDLLGSVRTGEPSFERVHGMAAFDYFADHPDEATVFDAAMTSFTRMVALAVRVAYDFSSVPRLIDVGGGEGSLLTGILADNARCSGTVFDLPRLEAPARANIDGAGLAARCDFIGGDFFKSVPGGYDAYLLKHVIHDWNDEAAVQILRTIRGAIGADARVLIVESIYPERIDDSDASRGAARNDCNMLVATGGRQRTEGEFRALYEAAGFRLARIVPAGAISSILEATPA